MMTFKLTVGCNQWLYEGPKAVHRARFAAKLMMRRLGLRVAYIVPYCANGETIIVDR